VSLGCPKNLVDSERMLAGLALAGLVVTAEADGADVAVVNTCAFIDLARAESDRHLDRLEALKSRGRLKRIVVAGCMAQRYGRRILRRHPTVDAIVGVADRDAMAKVCRSILGLPARRQGRARQVAAQAGTEEPVVRVSPNTDAPPDDRERLRLTPRHYAYLRISEGCDNRCAYCVIPEIRGPLRSKPPDQVIAEAEELAADGAKELILIGQDTTAYGRDFARRRAAAPHAGRSRSLAGWTLGRLLGELRRRVRVPWIRVMYAHPASFGDDVIEQLAAGPPLAPYVDLPLQHVNDAILASMGRRVGRSEIEDLIGRLRLAVPSVAIRTSFIVGYPGERQEQFEELLAFMREVRFDHVGVFVYSPEEGTRAAGLPGRVPASVAWRRWQRLMGAAEHLAHAAARRRVGQTIDVLVDGPDETGRLAARHAGQAPDVDAAVLLARGAAEVGRFARVRITGAEGYDLLGEVIRNRNA
jgi:ribosomal protein S12 methylthiotransferase